MEGAQRQTARARREQGRLTSGELGFEPDLEPVSVDPRDVDRGRSEISDVDRF
jgi:hypothetical protein